uniref:Uncharacterized protein n=1 Tax=Ralstonia syzygii R24 TaxID=907261 RepID=G3A0G9_9RALS|nr:hypothetical protein RALSY_10650 [Ralstonia syzygii R24]
MLYGVISIIPAFLVDCRDVLFENRWRSVTVFPADPCSSWLCGQRGVDYVMHILFAGKRIMKTRN